jgi:hypothetical protein
VLLDQSPALAGIHDREANTAVLGFRRGAS